MQVPEESKLDEIKNIVGRLTLTERGPRLDKIQGEKKEDADI